MDLSATEESYASLYKHVQYVCTHVSMSFIILCVTFHFYKDSRLCGDLKDLKVSVIDSMFELTGWCHCRLLILPCETVLH